MRKLNDAKIRIRNLERNNMNRSRTRTLDTSLISTISEMKTCDSIVNDEPACDKEIDFEDEYFDPELLDLERVRPTPKLCPHYPLPHSMVPVSSRYIKRVGLWRDSNVNGLNSTLIDSIGQFTSVEDEKIDWSQMSIFGDRVNSGDLDIHMGEITTRSIKDTSNTLKEAASMKLLQLFARRIVLNNKMQILLSLWLKRLLRKIL